MEIIQVNKYKQSIKKQDKLLGYNYITTCYRNNFCTIKIIRKGNQDFLIKQFKKEYVYKNDKGKIFQNELEITNIISKIQFDLLLDFKFSYNNKSSIDLLYDYFPLIYPFEDLLDKKFNIDEARFYFANFLHLFDFFKENSIILRNFSYSNVFLDKTGYIKYITLDSCKIIKDKTYTILGQPKYLCPEIIKHDGYSFESHYFLLGIIIYELLHQENPFEDKDVMTTYKNILDYKYKPIVTDRDLKLLIVQLLTPSKNRLGTGKRGVNEITNHKTFLNFNWKNFVERTMIPPFNTEHIFQRANDKASNEIYYKNTKDYRNSPDMELLISLKDKPWKDEVTNKNEVLGFEESYFEFMNLYDNN